MKKILLLAVSAFALNLSAQTIPNNDFENWTVHDDPQSSGVVVDSLESGYWESGNPMLVSLPSLAAGLPKGFMYDTTFAHSGSHAVAMRTGFLNGLTATGNLFNGVIDASLNGITEVVNTYNPLAPATTGAPSTATPSRLKGYYYYEPTTDYIEFNIGTQQNDSLFGTSDTCLIACIVHQWNAGMSKRDTVAYGEFKTHQTSTGFAPFQIDLNYAQASAGDSISILFMSSSQGLRFAGAYGSLLVVDSISFEGDYLGIDTFEDESNTQVYSYENSISINNVVKEDRVVVQDLLGRVIFEEGLYQGNNKFQLSGNGVFIVSVFADNKKVKTKKIHLNQ